MIHLVAFFMRVIKMFRGFTQKLRGTPKVIFIMNGDCDKTIPVFSFYVWLYFLVKDYF